MIALPTMWLHLQRKSQQFFENATKDPVISPFADVFQGVACLLGEYSIQLNKDHLVCAPHEESLFTGRKQ